MIELDIVSATARRDGKVLDLPPRELALLIALALPPRIWPSYRLAALLWAGSPVPGRSCLKVYVHRLRRRLGPSIIASTNKGYELDAATRVDLWHVQLLLKKPLLTETQRRLISRFYECAQYADRSAVTGRWWFAPVENMIDAAIGEIPLRLASDALSRDESDECLAIARAALSRHPGDHRLREIAIRAHLRRRDQHAALREYEAFLVEHRKTHVVDAPVAAYLHNMISSASASRSFTHTRQPAVSS